MGGRANAKMIRFSCNENKTLDFYFHLPTVVKTIIPSLSALPTKARILCLDSL
jgi:hypothetical protein